MMLYILLPITLKLSVYMKVTYVPIGRGMDKEDVVHIYDGILLSHYKERNNGIFSKVDGPRNYHAK